MPWSTREIADLAGTTVNTVRHYHRSGILDEPDRMSNGYKQYGARHLVRLLQIRRLRDLGVPLAQIETVGDGDSAAAALLAIDTDLAASIERLQRARAEIRAILTGSTTTDVPPGFEDVAAKLSSADRSLMLVYSQLYDESAMADLRQMVESGPDSTDSEFEALAPDADDETRRSVAKNLARVLAEHLQTYPWLTQPEKHLSKGVRVTQQTFLETIVELYNEAQLDVLGRASILANDYVGAATSAVEGNTHPTAPDDPSVGDPPPGAA